MWLAAIAPARCSSRSRGRTSPSTGMTCRVVRWVRRRCSTVGARCGRILGAPQSRPAGSQEAATRFQIRDARLRIGDLDRWRMRIEIYLARDGTCGTASRLRGCRSYSGRSAAAQRRYWLCNSNQQLSGKGFPSVAIERQESSSPIRKVIWTARALPISTKPGPR